MVCWIRTLSPSYRPYRWFVSARPSETAADTDPPGRSRGARETEPSLYNRSFAVGFASQFFLVVANTLMAHYARWVEFLGGGVSDVGWVMGVGAVLGLVLRPWMGQWINRLGARTTWAIGLALFEIGVLGNLWIHEVNLALYALRACLMMGIALVFASGLTYITQAAPPLRRTEAIGMFGAAGFVGMLAGPFLGDLILGDSGRARANFVILFAVAGTAVALAGLLLMRVRAPRLDSRSRAVRLSDFLSTARRHWPGSILLVNVAFGLCLIVPFGFLPSYIDHAQLRTSGVTPFGLFFLAYGGWGLTIRLLTRQIPDRIGRRKVLLAGMSFYTIGMFCFPLVDAANPWLLLVPGLLCRTAVPAQATHFRFPRSTHWRWSDFRRKSAVPARCCR